MKKPLIENGPKRELKEGPRVPILTPSRLALASIFAGQFAVPSVQALPHDGWYDSERQVFVSAATGEPAFVGSVLLASDTSISYSDFSRPTGSNGSDDTTYSAPDGFKSDG